MRFFQQYRTPLVVLAAVLLPLAVYRAHVVRPSRANLIDKLVLAATAPARRFLMSATGGASDAWYAYVDVAHARAEYSALRLELIQKQREMDRLKSLAVDNAELRRLLKIVEDNADFEMKAADVIGMSTSPSARTVEIDQGSLDGIPQGAPVINGQGLVGLVQRVGWTSSEVLLIVDETISLHVKVQRTRARGRIRGHGLAPEFGLELTEILRSDDLEPGDRIVTSGLGQVFPAGLSVGQVVGIRTEPGVQHRIADVAPYVDFARLERVLVIVVHAPADRIVTPEPLLPPSLRRVRSSDGGVTDVGVTDADTSTRSGP